MKTKRHLRMSGSSDLTLCLIREELKSRKFFSGLQQLGLDYCFYQPHLDKPILSAVGLDDESDEVFAFYFKLIEKRSRKIRKDPDSIKKHAGKAYDALMEERERKFSMAVPDQTFEISIPEHEHEYWL